MTYMKDGLRSSRASMPQKDYIILGNNVYKRTDKLPEDVMDDLLDEEEEVAPVAQKSNRSIVVTREWLGRLILEVQHKLWGQRNKYLRYNCSKWRTMGAQKRSCILAQSIVDAINIIK